MDSELCRVCEERGWEGESGVGIFMRVLVESNGFFCDMLGWFSGGSNDGCLRVFISPINC